jgi:hypothetical protein
MHEMRISRRGFLTQSSMIATVGATAPFLSASPLLLEQQKEGTHGAAESSSHQHHVVVPLYRAGKLIEHVSGDPAQVGSHVILRILNDDGFIVFPHRHPTDEHITVVQGTWYLGPGETFDRNLLEEMPIGAYGMVPKGMAHFAWSRGETIIQVHGIGPGTVNLIDFVEPLISLSDPNGPAHFKYKMSQHVLSEKGAGVITTGLAMAKPGLVQYGIRKDDGGVFWALEEDVKPLPATQV